MFYLLSPQQRKVLAYKPTLDELHDFIRTATGKEPEEGLSLLGCVIAVDVKKNNS